MIIHLLVVEETDTQEATLTDHKSQTTFLHASSLFQIQAVVRDGEQSVAKPQSTSLLGKTFRKCGRWNTNWIYSDFVTGNFRTFVLTENVPRSDLS